MSVYITTTKSMSSGVAAISYFTISIQAIRLHPQKIDDKSSLNLDLVFV